MWTEAALRRNRQMNSPGACFRGLESRRLAYCRPMFGNVLWSGVMDKELGLCFLFQLDNDCV